MNDHYDGPATAPLPSVTFQLAKILAGWYSSLKYIHVLALSPRILNALGPNLPSSFSEITPFLDKGRYILAPATIVKWVSPPRSVPNPAWMAD